MFPRSFVISFGFLSLLSSLLKTLVQSKPFAEEYGETNIRHPIRISEEPLPINGMNEWRDSRPAYWSENEAIFPRQPTILDDGNNQGLPQFLNKRKDPYVLLNLAYDEKKFPTQIRGREAVMVNSLPVERRTSQITKQPGDAFEEAIKIGLGEKYDRDKGDKQKASRDLDAAKSNLKNANYRLDHTVAAHKFDEKKGLLSVKEPEYVSSNNLRKRTRSLDEETPIRLHKDVHYQERGQSLWRKIGKSTSWGSGEAGTSLTSSFASPQYKKVLQKETYSSSQDQKPNFPENLNLQNSGTSSNRCDPNVYNPKSGFTPCPYVPDYERIRVDDQA